MPSRDRIIAAARGWVGTRFSHQGRVRKSASHSGGVDCLGLLIGIARELDLRAATGAPLAAFDEQNYAHYPDPAHLRSVLDCVLIPIAEAELQPGDVLILEIDGRAQHLAIVSDYHGGFGLIHAYAPAKAVVEHALDAWWRARIAGSYRVSL